LTPLDAPPSRSLNYRFIWTLEALTEPSALMTTASRSRSTRPLELPVAEHVPPFEPPAWLRGPHAQTLIARFWPWPRHRLASKYVEIAVDDGDRITLLDSTPHGWAAGDPSALLIHGLGGSARSPYIVRVGRKLADLGVRVVRMNLRGAGTGFGSARRFYHSGKTEDLRAVVGWLADRAPGSPIALIGFSLGANLALKLAGEAADQPVPGLDCVIAANPPIDLDACCRHIRQPGGRVYDRGFVRLLRAEVARLQAAFPDLDPVDLSATTSLLDFDEKYTAPLNGFRDAADYYARASAAPMVDKIPVPGLVIHAEDDPFIPAEPFRRLAFPDHLALELIPSGGHLGFLSRTRWRGDRRWLDARIIAWLAAHWDVTFFGAEPGRLDNPPRRMEVGRP
jgi:predicted alpha/beta-fold hydrolase